jgi:hypothetical protein
MTKAVLQKNMPKKWPKIINILVMNNKYKALEYALAQEPKSVRKKILQALEEEERRLTFEIRKRKDLEANIAKVKALFEEILAEKRNELVGVKQSLLKNWLESAKDKKLGTAEQQVLNDLISQEVEFLGTMDAVPPELLQELLQAPKTENKPARKFDFTDEHMQKLKDIIDQSVSKQREEVHINYKKLYHKLTRFAQPDFAKTDEEKTIKQDVLDRIEAAWEYMDYSALVNMWLVIDPENLLDVTLSEENILDFIEEIRLSIKTEKSNLNQLKESQDYLLYYPYYDKSQYRMEENIDNYRDVLELSLELSQVELQISEDFARLKERLVSSPEYKQAEPKSKNFFWPKITKLSPERMVEINEDLALLNKKR